MALAIAAAVTAQPHAPAFALRSELVYREEVGLALFAGGYVIVLMLALAARGQFVRRVELPGGAAVEVSELAERSDQVLATLSVQDRRLDDLADRLDRLDAAVARLEEA